MTFGPRSRVAYAVVGALALCGCQQTIQEKFRTPQAYNMSMAPDKVAVVTTEPRTESGVVFEDYGWWMPLGWAYGETFSLPPSDSGQQIIRAERWDSWLLSLAYKSKNIAVWGIDGGLLYNWGYAAVAGGLAYRHTWHQVTALDGEARIEENTDIAFGLVTIDRDADRKSHLRIAGLQVY